MRQLLRRHRLALWLAASVAFSAVGVEVAAAERVPAKAHTGVVRIELSSPTPGVVVSGDRRSLTYVAPLVSTSSPGASPFVLRVTSTGALGARVRITQTIVPAPFRSLLGPGTSPVREFTLRRGQSRTLWAGIAWSELANVHSGRTVSITYTVRAMPVCR